MLLERPIGPHASCVSAVALCLLAPSVPSRSSLTIGRMPPDAEISSELRDRTSSSTPGMSEARSASTAAACSCARALSTAPSGRSSLPAAALAAAAELLRKTSTTARVHGECAIELLEAASVITASIQSVYSCASTEPSRSSATMRSIPPGIVATVTCDSALPSAAISRRVDEAH